MPHNGFENREIPNLTSRTLFRHSWLTWLSCRWGGEPSEVMSAFTEPWPYGDSYTEARKA